MRTLPAMAAAGCGVTFANIQSLSSGSGIPQRRPISSGDAGAGRYPSPRLMHPFTHSANSGPPHGHELVCHALAVGRDHSVDVNQVRKALGTNFGDARL